MNSPWPGSIGDRKVYKREFGQRRARCSVATTGCINGPIEVVPLAGVSDA